MRMRIPSPRRADARSDSLPTRLASSHVPVGDLARRNADGNIEFVGRTELSRSRFADSDRTRDVAVSRSTHGRAGRCGG